QQVLAAFPDRSWTLFSLDPQTLKPVSSLLLPGVPEFIISCNNGRHCWVSLAGGVAVRVDLSLGTIDRQFRYDAEQTPVWSIATPPGQPDVLVVALDPGYRGNNRLRVFDNGIARPVEFRLLSWSGGSLPMIFVPDGRLFLACSQILRELHLTPSGLQEVRYQDTAAEYYELSLSYAVGRLFFASGRNVDLATRVVANSPVPTFPVVADDETRTLYTASGNWIPSGGSRMIIQCLDAATFASQWRAVLDLPASDVSGILPMGTNGCLVSGTSLWLVRPQLFGAQAAEMVLSVSNALTAANVGYPFPVQFSVTNRSVWTAQNATLSVDLGPGLAFADGTSGTHRMIALGDLNGSTNFSLSLLPTSNGFSTVVLQATNTLPQVNPDQSRQEFALSILPPPSSPV
ncbi:MAG TPA: hypothetical protein VEC99_03230, partial [Clostridia bacterium]|nr:hypothetical protein [Clostridia bacterium]